ncbi:class I SAM-dependent methyltransferase [Microvirga terrae]|uniref:Class I SAM-dependent methyltransferase n=1 Tax=Microvirga terrae TaxID=2740529 RepID=A0ABY5RSV5_9HYPH|nr:MULTISPECIES: class I SAM-dependent methyltransferase [Microvirga]UVF19862.1 class I SAM-dependent methyltransferase [Microvirga terrae]
MGDQQDDTRLMARRSYSTFADRYSALAPMKPHNGLYERPATLNLLGDVEGLRVLDAACGPGINSEILARRGATIHGFDITPEMIDLARQRCDGLPAEFRVADLTEPLGWLGGSSFDKILCALALDYVEDLTPVLRELRRACRPGGTLAFSMAHPMADWMHPEIRQESIYYERSRFGMHWTGFGEPRPYVEAYRRPLADIMNGLVEAGWVFDRLVEPKPLPEMKEVSERLYEQLSRAPAFICVRARC